MDNFFEDFGKRLRGGLGGFEESGGFQTLDSLRRMMDRMMSMPVHRAAVFGMGVFALGGTSLLSLLILLSTLYLLFLLFRLLWGDDEPAFTMEERPEVYH